MRVCIHIILYTHLNTDGHTCIRKKQGKLHKLAQFTLFCVLNCTPKRIWKSDWQPDEKSKIQSGNQSRVGHSELIILFHVSYC